MKKSSSKSSRYTTNFSSAKSNFSSAALATVTFASSDTAPVSIGRFSVLVKNVGRQCCAVVDGEPTCGLALSVDCGDTLLLSWQLMSFYVC